MIMDLLMGRAQGDSLLQEADGCAIVPISRKRKFFRHRLLTMGPSE
jgi:hypothetical protein